MVSISQGSGLLVRLGVLRLYRPGRRLVAPRLLVLLGVIRGLLDDAGVWWTGAYTTYRRMSSSPVLMMSCHVPARTCTLQPSSTSSWKLRSSSAGPLVTWPFRVQPDELVRFRVCLEPDEGAWRDRHQGHLKVSTRPSNHVLGRAMYAGERIGVTRNGKLAAVVIGVEDLEALEEFEMAQDLAAYREAKAADDGGGVTLDELRRGLAQ